MTGPAFEAAGLVRRDGELIEVVGGTPGPAGAAAIELTDGAVLSVDYAEPERFLDLSAETGSGLEYAVVDDLLGDEAARASDELTRGNTEGSIRLRHARTPGSSLPSPSGGNPAAGTLVQLADRASDPGRPVVEQAAAALDLARLVGDEAVPDSLRAASRELSNRAGELATEAADELVRLARRKPVLGKMLIAHHAEHLSPELIERLETLRPSRNWAGDERPAAMFALELPGALSRTAHHLGDFSETPPRTHVANMRVLPPFEPTVRSIDHGLWVVECGRADDESAPRWVRILDATLTTVAVAPVTESPLGGTAELLVPDDLDHETATIDVTTNPFPIPPTGLDAIAEAVRAGRRAADLECAAQWGQARRAWDECAELWAGLGDEERAASARRFANRSAVGPQARRRFAGGPLVTDLVTEALTD
ncbi:MAG: hypothetical protein ACKO1Y_00220 [Actinomycetota bacterium]